MTFGIFIVGQDNILLKISIRCQLNFISIHLDVTLFLKSTSSVYFYFYKCIYEKKFMRSENADPHANMFSVI